MHSCVHTTHTYEGNVCVCVCVFVYIHTAACEFTMNIELRCARSYPEAETAHHSHV